jgi:hypothetical protein
MKTRQSRNLKYSMIALAILSGIMGCILVSPTKLITINIKEDQVNRIIKESSGKIQGEGWTFVVQNVDMQDGFMRVFGDYQPEGKSSVAGSLDVTVSAEGGAMKVEVTAVDIEGLSLSDARIQRLNQEIQKGLSASAIEGRQSVTFDDIKVTDTTLQLRIRFLP